MERLPMNARIAPLAALLVSSLFLFACGGSGGGTTNPPATTAGSVSGTVLDGPVSGAVVTAYAITNGTMGAQVGGGTTDSSGNFHVSVGDYAGPMMLQASGGSYVDLATGSTMTMQAGDVMAAAIPAMMAYNYFVHRVRVFAGELEGFANELIGSMAREGML